MASSSVFDLTRFTALASGDVLAAVDISDTTQSAHGSLLSITVTNFFGAIPVPLIVTAPGTTSRFGATAVPASLSAGLPSRCLLSVTPDTNTNAARGSASLIVAYGVTPYFTGARAGGTVTAPIATPTTTALAVFGGAGYDGTDWHVGSAEIEIITLEGWTAGAQGAQIILKTCAIGSTGNVSTLSVSNTGTTSRIVPLATALAFRNNANSADNLLITNAGAGTFRAGLTIAGALAGVTTLAMNGALSGVTTLAVSSGATFGGAGVDFGINPGTSDGADSGLIWMGGGGGLSETRGAYIYLPGNEHAGNGAVTIASGNHASAVVSIKVAGTEKLKVDQTATATHTALSVWDVDNATLERVTVGAADSGGLGFKVLRIPN